MALGNPGIAPLRSLDLRALQDILDSVRQRLKLLDAEVTRLGTSSDSASLQQQITALQRAAQQLTSRVSVLEAALGTTDTFSLAAAEVIAQHQVVVPAGPNQCKVCDPSDPIARYGALGVATAAANVGQAVTIQRRGQLTLSITGLEVGKPVFVAPGGTITQNATYGSTAVIVGTAMSSSVIWIGPGSPTLLAPGTYADTFEDAMPVAWSLVEPFVQAMQLLLALTDGYVYLYQGSLITVPGGGGGGAVSSVNGQIGDVLLALGDLVGVITAGATDGDTLVLRSDTWVAEASPGTFTAASAAPGSPAVGARWFDLDTGICYTYVYDGTSFQWVEL